MQKKTKIIAGVSTVLVLGLLVGVSLQGGLDQLQGRFSNNFNQKSFDVSIEFEEKTYQDYLDEMDDFVAEAEVAHDTAYNAYLTAMIPGLEEEGPEDYAYYSAIVSEQSEVLEGIYDEALTNYQAFYATHPGNEKPAVYVVWSGQQENLSELTASVSSMKNEVRAWTYDL